MNNNSKLRRWIGIPVLFIICIALAVIYWPRSIGSILDFANANDIRVTVIISDANTPGEIKTESMDYIFQRGSTQYNELLAILSKYAYHETIFTLRNDQRIESSGRVDGIYTTISIGDSTWENDFIFGNHSGANAIINKNTVQVGYFGNGTMNRLFDDIIAVCDE